MPLSASGPLPKCKTMLTCERTVIDAQTGMPSLFNVFFKFRIPSQPGLTIPFSLFVQLTGGLGEYEFAAEFHDLEEGKTLRRAVGNIRMVDKLEMVNIHFNFNPIEIPHSGRYDLIVFANGQEVDQLSFEVLGTTNSGTSAPSS